MLCEKKIKIVQITFSTYSKWRICSMQRCSANRTNVSKNTIHVGLLMQSSSNLQYNYPLLSRCSALSGHDPQCTRILDLTFWSKIWHTVHVISNKNRPLPQNLNKKKYHTSTFVIFAFMPLVRFFLQSSIWELALFLFFQAGKTWNTLVGNLSVANQSSYL